MVTSVIDDDALLPLAFSLYSSPGAYGLLLGAGVSAPSGIPTAWGVIENLTSRVAQLVGESPEDSVTWYESKYKQPAQYETLLERLAPTPLERQRLLRSYFEPSDDDRDNGRKSPTPAHKAIARLVRAGTIRIIVTLNFDRLMEQAVQAEGIEPTVVASPADAAGLGPLHMLDCCIVHLHGDYLSPSSMLNTLDELKAYPPEMTDLLQRILGDYGLIVAGWSSVYDPALRDAIARHYPSRLSLAWVDLSEPKAEATQLATLKRGSFLHSSADQAFGELADAVEALAMRETRHPLALSVAVETAKRELAGGKVAIGLHDRLGQEMTRLHNLDDFHLPNHRSAEEHGGYPGMFARVREASRVPAGLVATLAYWGTDVTDRWWLDDVGRLAITARGSGSTNLLELRHVAGSVLFLAAGVAAVASRRYGLLKQLFALQRPNPYKSRDETVLNVFRSVDAHPVEGAEDLYHFVTPILQESLGIGTDALDDAWQTFEVIRNAFLIETDSRFNEQRDAYLGESERYGDAIVSFGMSVSDGDEPSSATQARAEARLAMDRTVGQIANLYSGGHPHVLVSDLHGEVGFRSPIAERLAADLEAQGKAHELVRGGFVENPFSFALALQAASVALGRTGNDLTWKRPSHHSGVIPSEIWLDTALTPEEIELSQRDAR
ncbi:SIR2-like domain-containing protein [Agreia bicolorata]|uniref:SIR2-like domain-containing protein n=1 Tax=Agreia bicolorata TaxID=110935 RepID=A0A1T4YM16_9MICO|nr:SIR2-like domain-containing protein [Agreia bicolorata]